MMDREKGIRMGGEGAVALLEFGFNDEDGTKNFTLGTLVELDVGWLVWTPKLDKLNWMTKMKFVDGTGGG